MTDTQDSAVDDTSTRELSIGGDRFDDDDLDSQLQLPILLEFSVQRKSKKFMTSNKWKSGYVMVRGHGFFLYKDKDLEKAPIRALSLKKCVVSMPGSATGTLKKAPEARTFYLRSSGAEEMFQAPTDADVDRLLRIWKSSWLPGSPESRHSVNSAAAPGGEEITRRVSIDSHGVSNQTSLAGFVSGPATFMTNNTSSLTGSPRVDQGKDKDKKRWNFNWLKSQQGHPTAARHQSRCFGHSLEEYLSQRPNLIVPLVVSKCIAEVQCRGMDSVGIYRLSGSKQGVEAIKEEFDTNDEMVELGPDKYDDINTVSGCLKLYFRELPDPVLTEALYEPFVNAGKVADDDERKRLMAYLVQYQLPPRNFCVLQALIRHLVEVEKNGEVNKMKANNLAIVFGPTLVRTSQGEDLAGMIGDMAAQSKVVETMIVYYPFIFETPISAVEFEGRPGVMGSRTGSNLSVSNKETDGVSMGTLSTSASQASLDVQAALSLPPTPSAVQTPPQHAPFVPAPYKKSAAGQQQPSVSTPNLTFHSAPSTPPTLETVVEKQHLVATATATAAPTGEQVPAAKTVIEPPPSSSSGSQADFSVEPAIVSGPAAARSEPAPHSLADPARSTSPAPACGGAKEKEKEKEHRPATPPLQPPAYPKGSGSSPTKRTAATAEHATASPSTEQISDSNSNAASAHAQPEKYRQLQQNLDYSTKREEERMQELKRVNDSLDSEITELWLKVQNDDKIVIPAPLKQLETVNPLEHTHTTSTASPATPGPVAPTPTPAVAAAAAAAAAAPVGVFEDQKQMKSTPSAGTATVAENVVNVKATQDKPAVSNPSKAVLTAQATPGDAGVSSSKGGEKEESGEGQVGTGGETLEVEEVESRRPKPSEVREQQRRLSLQMAEEKEREKAKEKEKEKERVRQAQAATESTNVQWQNEIATATEISTAAAAAAAAAATASTTTAQGGSRPSTPTVPEEEEEYVPAPKPSEVLAQQRRLSLQSSSGSFSSSADQVAYPTRRASQNQRVALAQRTSTGTAAAATETPTQTPPVQQGGDGSFQPISSFRRFRRASAAEPNTAVVAGAGNGVSDSSITGEKPRTNSNASTTPAPNATPTVVAPSSSGSENVVAGGDDPMFRKVKKAISTPALSMSGQQQNYREGKLGEAGAPSVDDLLSKGVPITRAALRGSLGEGRKGPKEVAVQVEVEWAAEEGQAVGLAGNLPVLGDWNPREFKALVQTSTGTWVTDFHAPSGARLEYKYLVFRTDTNTFLRWENIKGHRQLFLTRSTTIRQAFDNQEDE